MYPPQMLIEEVALAARVAVMTVRRAVMAGRLHPTRPGKRLLFAREEVLAWLSSDSASATEAPAPTQAAG